MVFRLALAGMLPADSDIPQQAEGILSRLREELHEDIRILVSHAYTDLSWKPLAMAYGESICGFSREACDGWDSVCARILREDPCSRTHLAEELCDSADLLILIWDEDTTSREGSGWELLQIAHRQGIPCLWISSKTGRVFWSEESFFTPCEPNHLERVAQAFRMEDLSSEIPEGKRIFLLDLGVALRERFLRRYKAKGGAVPPEKDSLLTSEGSIADISPEGEALRRRLLEAFNRYDKTAIALNSRYQSVLYWRSVLPFAASIFIALGFYAENVLGILPGTKPGFWVVVAGFGFLIHGLLNLYVFLLSKSKAIQSWHSGYLDCRYMAELLRVLIHFAPYGIQLNLAGLCRKDPRLYRTVRRLSDREKGRNNIGPDAIDSILDHLEQLLEDQIAYHRAARDRYSRIVHSLDRWYHTAFAVGFAAVVLRALFQAVLALWPITSGSLNGIPLQKFAGSFANMLALMLPGWASYCLVWPVQKGNSEAPVIRRR